MEKSVSSFLPKEYLSHERTSNSPGGVTLRRGHTGRCTEDRLLAGECKKGERGPSHDGIEDEARWRYLGSNGLFKRQWMPGTDILRAAIRCEKSHRSRRMETDILCRRSMSSPEYSL